jgi:hypothetical protein
MTNTAIRSLPGWRQPMGVCDDDGRERQSLADAVVELSTDRVQTFDELLASVREDWGSCERDQLRAVLDWLVEDRAIRRTSSGYVRAERGRR